MLGRVPDNQIGKILVVDKSKIFNIENSNFEIVPILLLILTQLLMGLFF